MLSHTDLTDEQQAVVEHGDGPAVVRAVPGAGKTTAMIHHIRVLVKERGVPPDRILASSFSRATVQDLETGLATLGVSGVDTRTLHAVGLSLLRRSDTVNEPSFNSAPDPDAAGRILAHRARTDLAAERDLDTGELGISTREVVNQIAAWKQQLAYPDPNAAGLSADAREIARAATHENEDFLALYRRFETHRQHEGWLTYPDMLQASWETLLHDDAIRAEMQDAYRHVIVDEFQDVSRAQFHLLDLLTERHRNFVVIGDADQCIYRWRGADPSFLLDISERYDATEYVLTDSFRLPAAPLVLANAVIRHNETRRPKRLHLTRGVTGDAHLLDADDPSHAAARIADTVVSLQEDGFGLNEMAILVRTYGQTPPLERTFIERGLPYRLRGSAPFYRRREVQTLLRYLYWAVLERQLRQNGWFDDETTAARYADRFAHILKTPTRYVQHGRIDRITQQARAQQTSVLDMLGEHRPEMHERTAERVDRFLDTAEELTDRLDAPPNETLDWLIEAIDYEAALRERSAFAERGDARVRTARALVRYSESHDSAPNLLRAVRTLDARQRSLDDTAPALDLRSIHRAKGAEWPVVFVPGCTEGTLPLDTDAGADSDLEEERRLFYVALTRPREHLYLVTDNSAERSRFLDEAAVDTRLPTVRQIGHALSTAPNDLSDNDLIHLCRGLTELDLERYLHQWWAPSNEQTAALRNRLDALAPAIERATKRRKAYRQAQAEHEARKRQARKRATDRLDELRSTLGTSALTATNEQPDTYYPDDARFSFDWVDDASQIGVYWNGTRVGTLDPFGPHRLDAPTLLDLPWDAMVGRFERVAQGRTALYITIDWQETGTILTKKATSDASPPTAPPKQTRLLTSDPFKNGYSLLRNVLSTPEPKSA